MIAARRGQLSTKEGFRSLLARMLAIALIGYIFFAHVFLIARVSGLDMFPAMKDGDLAVVFRLQREYAKEDVIAYRTEDGIRFGRVIARAGDVVTMDDSGTLLVNGTAQTGDILYPTYAEEGIEYPYRVPDGCVFVLGDYRTKATDSRILGPIAMDDVAGKVIAILRRRDL